MSGLRITPHILIIGDSIVYRAAIWAHQRQQEHLGLPVKLTWRGKRGLHLSGTGGFTQSLLRTVGPVTHIILHVGTNDI